MSSVPRTPSSASPGSPSPVEGPAAPAARGPVAGSDPLAPGDGLDTENACRPDLFGALLRPDGGPPMSRVEGFGDALEEIFLRRLGDVPRPAPAISQSSVDVTRRPMDDVSPYVPRNNKEKRAVFDRLFAADQALDRARAGKSPEAIAAAEAEVAGAEADLRALMKKQTPGKDAEIDALDIGARTEKQTTYRVDVGGTRVVLTDNNRSYATTHRSGLEVKSRGEPVAPVIDATSLSSSTKTVLRATSAHEGTFGSVNGYDRMGVSFGFIQFAGGGAGSMLCKVIARFKEKDPAAFAEMLGKQGIDVQGRPPQLVCKDADGNLLRGDAAARRIGSDPVLCAALSASAGSLSMKAAQVEIAAGLLATQRQHAAPGSSVAVGQILTSEYANGLLYDRSVNLGGPGTLAAFDRIVNQHLQANPGADLASDPARAAIEAAFITWAERAAPARAAGISSATDHAPGSFVS
jgi:hypothetical protein